MGTGKTFSCAEAVRSRSPGLTATRSQELPLEVGSGRTEFAPRAQSSGGPKAHRQRVVIIDERSPFGSGGLGGDDGDGRGQAHRLGPRRGPGSRRSCTTTRPNCGGRRPVHPDGDENRPEQLDVDIKGRAGPGSISHKDPVLYRQGDRRRPVEEDSSRGWQIASTRSWSTIRVVSATRSRRASPRRRCRLLERDFDGRSGPCSRTTTAGRRLGHRKGPRFTVVHFRERVADYLAVRAISKMLEQYLGAARVVSRLRPARCLPTKSRAKSVARDAGERRLAEGWKLVCGPIEDDD